MTEEKNLLTVKELANFLGVAEITVYKWSARGFIPYYRFGRKKMFSREKVMEWAEKRGSQGRVRAGRVNQHV